MLKSMILDIEGHSIKHHIIRRRFFSEKSVKTEKVKVIFCVQTDNFPPMQKSGEPFFGSVSSWQMLDPWSFFLNNVF